MMTIYIDTVFFDEFAERNDMENEIVEDFYKIFLRKVRGAQIVINLISQEKLRQLSEASRYYSDLLEINSGILLNSEWKREILQEIDIHDGNPIKLFLLSNQDDCDALENQYGYLFLNNKNLIEKWNPVRYNRDITELTPGTTKDDFTFSCWNSLNKEKSPLTELLILDLFLLEDKNNQKIKNNIIPLIKSFADNSKKKIRVVVIADRILNSNSSRKYEKLNDAYNCIRSEISNIELCVIHYDKESKSSYTKMGDFRPEHDREIYTNYLKFKSGIGWNLFKSTGKLNDERTTITVQSIFRNDVRKSALIAWGNLSAYKSKICNGIDKIDSGVYDEKGNICFKRVDFICPVDFKSNFLN